MIPSIASHSIRAEQIAPLTLLEKHSLFAELSLAKPENAAHSAKIKQAIATLKADSDWTDPEVFEATAKVVCHVDGVPVRKGETVKLFYWQFSALSRFFDLSPESQARFEAAAAAAKTARLNETMRQDAQFAD